MIFTLDLERADGKYNWYEKVHNEDSSNKVLFLNFNT